MIFTYQITAIDLTTSNNPKYYHINRVLCNWIDVVTNLPVKGWMDRQYVAEQIDKGQARAFVKVANETIGVSVQKGERGIKYLRTRADNHIEDNLLSLDRYYNGVRGIKIIR